MFLLIFIEYLQTRRLFRRMNSHQRRAYVQQPALRNHARSGSVATSVITSGGRPASATGSHFGALQQRQGGIYDRWLVARTSLCVIALT